MASVDFIYGFLMFLNAMLLAILVPGGPIENRDFSHMRGFSYWGFNGFLIALGLSSLIACYMFLVGSDKAVYLGIALTGFYLAVYALDLAGLYPKSSTKMSDLLMLIEIMNAGVATFTFIVYLSVL